MQHEQIEVSFDVGGAYDMLASLMVLFNPEFFGARAAWAAGMLKRLPKTSRDALELMMLRAQIGPYWLTKLNTAKDSRSVLDALSMMPPLKRLELFYLPTPEQLAIFHAVAAKHSWDEADRISLIQTIDHEVHLKEIEEDNATQALTIWAGAEFHANSFLAALRDYYELFYAAEEQRILPSLQRALEYARQRASEIPLSPLLEELSRGVNLDAQLNLPKLLLIPSFWSTPIVLLGHLPPDTRLIFFGARAIEESLAPGEVASDTLVSILKALADPTRLAILHYLSDESLQPTQLAARLRLRPATVSHHLKILRLAGLVRLRLGVGKEVIYSSRSETIDQAFAILKNTIRPSEHP